MSQHSEPRDQGPASQSDGREQSQKPPENASSLLHVSAELQQEPDPTGLIGHVVEANEQLVLASLHADQLAETAVHELDELTRAGQRDALTDTPNRALMLDRLEHAVAVAKRNESRIAVLFVDIDGFKHVNDTLGHTAGDEVLRAAARRLESAVRGSDTVSRHGGDEFLVLLAEVAHSSDAAVVAKKMLTALAAPVRAGIELLFISASIGIAIYPDDGADASTLIHCADTAMYRSKRNARGRYAFHGDATHKTEPGPTVTALPPRTVSRHETKRLEEKQRREEEQERILRNLREANANLVAATLRYEQERDRPEAASNSQLELQAMVARQLRSSFTPTLEAVELLNQVHTSEPLLQVLIEREVAHLSAPRYESFDSPRTNPARFVRSDTRKTAQFNAVASDGAHFTVLEFTVTAHVGTLDQTRRALTHKSFGLENGERVDCLGLMEFQVASNGVRLHKTEPRPAQ